MESVLARSQLPLGGHAWYVIVQSYANISFVQVFLLAAADGRLKGAYSLPEETLARILFRAKTDLVVRTSCTDRFNHLVAIVARIVSDCRYVCSVDRTYDLEAMGLGEAIEPLEAEVSET